MRLKRKLTTLCSAFVFVCVAYASLVSFVSDENIADVDTTETHPTDLTTKGRAALVGLDTSEQLGGGAFAAHSSLMYEQYDGYRLGKAQSVKELTRNLNNSYFHLERQAFFRCKLRLDHDRCKGIRKCLGENLRAVRRTSHHAWGNAYVTPTRCAFESKVIVVHG